MTMYLDKRYLNSIREKLLQYSEDRREVIKMSGDALHIAKRVIFALHRDDVTEAEDKLAQVEEILLSLSLGNKKTRELDNEGSYLASLEEYVEAFILFSFVKNKKIKKLPVKVSDETYIAGMADVVGELYRLSIKYATQGNIVEVERVHDFAIEIVVELVECNLTKYLRTKFDQAKNALSKIEQVIYDLSVKR